MGSREGPFLERLRRFEDVLQQISKDFAGTHRLAPVLEMGPPRVVSVAVHRIGPVTPPARATAFVPASDRSDISSSEGQAELRRRIDSAVRELATTPLSIGQGQGSSTRSDS